MYFEKNLTVGEMDDTDRYLVANADGTLTQAGEKVQLAYVMVVDGIVRAALVMNN